MLSSLYKMFINLYPFLGVDVIKKSTLRGCPYLTCYKIVILQSTSKTHPLLTKAAFGTAVNSESLPSEHFLPTPLSSEERERTAKLSFKGSTKREHLWK